MATTSFLMESELLGTYYTRAKILPQEDVKLFLYRANAFCYGYIGGRPPQVDETLKVAVALAFEVFARGESKQINDETGNITELAPPSAAVQTTSKYAASDQFGTVKEMLEPYKKLVAEGAPDRGVRFL